MHGALGTLIWVVLIVAAVIALAAMAASGKAWDDFGKDRLMMDEQTGARPGSAGALHERDEEIRQMLTARNAHRTRRGETPVDVEQELRRLTRPAIEIDPELREEIRQLVEARNYRRTRAGKPPLDVDAEVEREIARLGDLG